MSKPTRYVIDCWDVRTPEEFWEHYLREVVPEGADRFGRNADAFRDALTGGGPGWPGDSECAIEITNLDELLANGHSDFVAFLEELGRELAGVPNVELMVFRPPPLRATLPTAIKLMADYQCWPLWEVEPDVGNIDPAELPVSKATRRALGRWAAAYDATLDQDYPPDSRFPDEEAEAAFEMEGLRLWRALRRELGERVRVLFRDLEPEDDVPRPSGSASGEADLRDIVAHRQVVRLLRNCRTMVSEETVAEVQRLLDHGEHEMAFEGLVLDLMESQDVQPYFDYEAVHSLGVKLGLNRESVFDGDFWAKLNAWVLQEPKPVADRPPPAHPEPGTPETTQPPRSEGFWCPECGEASLEITKAIELRPDARWSEITLQLLRCETCDFDGIGVYKENNWGSSEIVEYRSYRAPVSVRSRLSELIEACPKRSDRRCECLSCSVLSVTDDSGEWSWLERAGVVKPAAPPARSRWTFRRVFFWGMFALLTLGGVGAWFNELSRETGLWIELRDTWNWPPTLAKFGSLTGYVGMAFVASWITAMNVSWLVNEARAGYRRLRERRPKK